MESHFYTIKVHSKINFAYCGVVEGNYINFLCKNPYLKDSGRQFKKGGLPSVVFECNAFLLKKIKQF